MNETLTRTLSGAVYIALLVICSLFPISFLALFGVFLILCTLEFCRLVHLRPALPCAIASAFYLLSILTPDSDFTRWLLLAFALFSSIRLTIWLFSTRLERTDDTGKYANLIGYIILPIVLISWLPFTADGFRPWILLGIFILIWANDTFAFLFGKGFGKHKLFERVSPKKTVEGFIGGWIMALAFSIPVAIWLTKEPVFHWLCIATAVSFAGTVGDLVESKFKRVAGVKDSGNIMPGHGGILDRLDSIIFVAPFVFLFYQITAHVS